MADLEKELREGVTYFEQILSVLPGDRTALEFLCMAFERLGDRAKALDYTVALADVLIGDKDAKEAAPLVEKLKLYDDPRAKAAVLRLQVLVASPPELELGRYVPHDTCAKPSVAAKAEIELLNRLVSDGVLQQSFVKPAIDQLENLPTNVGEFLISALLILEKENLTGVADAVAAVADAAHAPPVPLESFEISPAHVRLLPEKLVKVRGVVPFAKLGREWAVAVLNPLDEALRIEVTEAIGARCHFFTAMPSSVEKALERVFRKEGAEVSYDPSNGLVSAVPPPMENPIS